MKFRVSRGGQFEAYDKYAAKKVARSEEVQNKVYSNGVLFRLQLKTHPEKVFSTVFTQKAPHESYGDAVRVRCVAKCLDHLPDPEVFRGYNLEIGGVTDCADLVEGESEEEQPKVRCMAEDEPGRCENVAEDGQLFCDEHIYKEVEPISSERLLAA